MSESKQHCSVIKGDHYTSLNIYASLYRSPLVLPQHWQERKGETLFCKILSIQKNGYKKADTGFQKQYRMRGESCGPIINLR